MTGLKKGFSMLTWLIGIGLLCASDALIHRSLAYQPGKPICKEYSWMGIATKDYCEYSKHVSEQCLQVKANSVYSQCNIYKLTLRKPVSRYDDNEQEFNSLIFKFRETNSCGSNDPNAWKCDSFAAYVQFIRNLANNKCYAFVNSALLGIRPTQQTERNDPNKPVKAVAIPGVSRRILFTPSNGKDFIMQPNAILLRTSDKGHNYFDGGDSISALSILELESPLTTKSDNLKANPGKIRIVRGEGSDADYLDLNLSSNDDEALLKIISSCS